MHRGRVRAVRYQRQDIRRHAKGSGDLRQAQHQVRQVVTTSPGSRRLAGPGEPRLAFRLSDGEEARRRRPCASTRGCSSRTAEEGHPSDRPQEQEGSREGKMKKEESKHVEDVPEWVARLEQLRRESAGGRNFWTPEEQIAQLRALNGWPEEIEQPFAVEGRHERPDLSALRRSLAEFITPRRAAKEREGYKDKREEVLTI